MAADIFGKTANVLGDAWSADGAAVSFPGASDMLGAGMIVQQVNVTYQQQVTRLWEVGSNLTYFVAGRVQGNMTVGRVVGPSVILATFYARFGNVCNAAQNTMNIYLGTGCAAGSGTKYQNGRFTISYAVLVSVGISVAAQDMVINEQLQLMFINMEATSGAGTGIGGVIGVGAGGVVGGFTTPPLGAAGAGQQLVA